MREGTKEFPPIPNWPGIRNPEAQDLILDKSNGIARTKLFGIMGKENFQSMGFPDVPATRKAIVEPELLDAPTNQAGFRMARMDTSGRIIEEPNIPSDYPTAMAGKVAGKLDVPADYKDVFQSHFDARRLLSQPESGDYYSFSRAHPIQYADDAWLNRLMEKRLADERKIKEGEYKDGGSVDINASDARLEAAIANRMAKGGEVDIEAADARLADAVGQRMAGGGKAKAIQGATQGFKRLFADRDAMPAAQRDANLQKFLEPSKAPMRLFHGTTATEGGKGTEAIRRIKPSKEGALGSGAYLTPKSNFASEYASEMGGNMLPVHAQIRNPLVIEGTGDPMIEALVKLGLDEDKAARMVERAYENKGYIGKEVESRARAAGYDGLMQYRNGDLNEVVSYNPNAIKSAIGNEGTYDISNPELSKADGGLAMAGGGKLVKGLGKIGKRLMADPDAMTPSVRRAERMADQMGGLNIVKDPGGNWLGAAGSPESGLYPLKKYASPSAEDKAWHKAHKEEWMAKPDSDAKTRALRAIDDDIAVNARNEALNNWVDRNLNNYVKKQMGTADDPVRKLAEEGVIHAPSEQIGRNRYKAGDVRKKLGTPQLGQSDAAKAWEDSTDTLIDVAPASRHRAPLTETEARQGFQSTVKANPWIAKLPPDTPIYAADRGIGTDLGFDHILDVLTEDLTAGRIRPEQLNKVSMEQAVRRTFDYDQEKARKMAEAQIKVTEGMPTHKDYSDKGYKWLQLAMPEPKLPEGAQVKYLPEVDMWGIYDKDGSTLSSGATEKEARNLFKRQEREKQLEDALKYEGDTMGHCVGGYCPDVMAGNSKIYSLRDAKGEPHVTVETRPGDFSAAFSDLTQEEQAAVRKAAGSWASDQDLLGAMKQVVPEKAVIPERIIQIKGKQNRAPKDDYLPFVQDFVKSGQWSDVGDLSNTGLYKADPNELGMFIPSDPRLKNLPGRRSEDFRKAKEAGLFGDQKYFTRDEWEDILRRQIEAESGPLPPVEGMAEGGAAFKKIQFMNKGGITTSGGTFSAEDLGITSDQLNAPLISAKRLRDIKRNAAELAEEGKGQLEKEYRQLGRKGGKKDFAIRVGSQFLGGIPDLVNLGLEGVDLVQGVIPGLNKPESVLDTEGTGDRVPKFRLASDEPWLGSQLFMRKFKEAKLLGENEFPLTEIATGVLAPAAAVGALSKSRQAYKGVKALKDAPNKRRGGLTAMAR
jgi:hypothetical protein